MESSAWMIFEIGIFLPPGVVPIRKLELLVFRLRRVVGLVCVTYLCLTQDIIVPTWLLVFNSLVTLDLEHCRRRTLISTYRVSEWPVALLYGFIK